MRAISVGCSVTGEVDTWTPIVENGFDNPANVAIPGWLQVGTSLYAGTTNLDQGAEIWRKAGTELPGRRAQSADGPAYIHGAIRQGAERGLKIQTWGLNLRKARWS